MANANHNPHDLISYGPNENCTLTPGPQYCPANVGVYEYRPSLAANSVFITLFGVALATHLVLGIRYKTWAFLFAIFWGCASEMIGYGGRVLMWGNPFSFTGFLVQIICITLGPAFYSAAIYLTLSKIIIFLGPQHARFSPKLYYWIFIPCDILSLILQAVGGALSSVSSGSSAAAVDVAIAGLSFQVFTLCVFIALGIEFSVRYIRAQRSQPRKTPLPTSFKIFVAFLSLSITCILIRCAYRIDELSDGYDGPLIHNEPLFIGLEGVMSVLAVYALVVAHPGPVFGRSDANMYESDVTAPSDGGTEKAEPGISATQQSV
ncbi:MAG: hypothetical protein ASARMPRED_007904 [Alectoria sarmentosa]|nr:MAG: hypothetical protein ASARMPRED_007904 [Alectoria sarmentosa]